MPSFHIPYFDPPAAPVPLAMPAAKMLQSVRNLSEQMALHAGSTEVLPEHVFDAVKLFLENVVRDEFSLIVPSGLKVNSAYKPDGGR